MKNDLNLSNLTDIYHAGLGKLHKYAALLFFIFVAVIYGFIMLQINSLSNPEPTQATISTKSKTPHIDKNVVSQLNQLKDNSVTVQTLFDEARNNPFNE